MEKEKAFGIGCFHFGIKKTPPFKYKGSQYIEELKNALSKIPNLNNLIINTDDEFKTFEIDINDKLPSLEDEDNFPNGLFFNLEFDLYIPYRIQEEIIEEGKKFLDTYSENFKITITHGYHTPVVIVEIKKPTKTPQPSTAVRLVREFINKELQNKSEYIKFECVGPSPFHLDCYLRPQKRESDDWLFDPKEIINLGFGHYVLNYNEKVFKNSDEALGYLKFYIQNEFGYYYSCVQIRNNKMHSWGRIQKNLEELQRIQEATNLKNLYKIFFKRYFLIEKLITDLTTFEGEEIINKGIKQSEYLQVYPTNDEAFFKTFIDRELKEKIDYPTKQATNLINFIENRRVKNFELFIILISAILGGLVGSLLSIYFQQIQK